MDAAIIAIGSEMLTPARVDTNSLYLTDHLNARGVEVLFKMIVGDNREHLVDAMRYALERVQLLILSGGLGPTEDDLTREAVAQLCERPLIFSDEQFAVLEERFRRMNRKMADVNKRQVFVIEGATVLPNPRGTAPGQWVEHGGSHIVLLPGPPNELKGVFQEQCIPKLDSLLPPQVIRTRFYRVAGMGESDLDQLIAPVYSKYTNPATTILAALGDIQIHLRARCKSEQEAEALLAELGSPIEELLGERIYSHGGAPIEQAIGDVLRERAMTITLAESCTGGMVAERITSVPGASDYFNAGFVTYSYAMKTNLLGVDPELLRTAKAVSEPVAKAMAAGARQRAGASIGVSVTGVAGPSQGEETEPPGVFFVGIADEACCYARRFQFSGDRNRIRTLATQTALDMVRRHLLKYEGSPWKQ